MTICSTSCQTRPRVSSGCVAVELLGLQCNSGEMAGINIEITTQEQRLVVPVTSHCPEIHAGILILIENVFCIHANKITE